MKKILLFLTLTCCLAAVSFGQAGVLDPNDPVVNYNAASPPATPVLNRITKWVRTPRMNWDATQFKCYIFQGVQFRLMFPRSYQHNVADGRKYPVAVFLHGLGERGTSFDNEYQLLHGGQTFRDRVNNGSYDGFLIYPQFGATNTGWGASHFSALARIVDSMVKYVKADQDRVFLHGLSIGGQGTWTFIEQFPRVFAGAAPISGASLGYIPGIPRYLEIPIRLYTGDRDNNPAPGTAVTLVDSFRNRGGSIVHTRYPNLGHGAWNTSWQDAAWVPFMNNVHKANPIVYFGRAEFCPGDPVSARLGLTSGFAEYQWDRDGIVIPGATSNTLTVTQFGTYRARFRRVAGGAWSEWSPTPVVVRIKPTTFTPPIQIEGLRSDVLPAVDGNTTVPLTVAGNFTSYEWRRVSDNQLVANTAVYNAPVGTYRLRVTEQFGCSSEFSPDYTVVAASGGTGLPDAAGGLLAVPASKTTMQLDWSDNPNAAFNETGFEIYRALKAGGPYTLVGKTGANVVSFLDQGLLPNTAYFYVVRSVNANGAAPLSTEAMGRTQVDDVAPETPRELTVASSSQTSITLQWNPSADDVGVDKYDVYVNNQKAYSTSENVFTVFNLNAFETYNFKVQARDAAGNLSPFSNQVTGQAAASGLSYKLYNGTWSVLPNFANLSPVQTGRSANVDITLRNQTSNYGFLWEGMIKIPVTGSYTFETCSDDGSKLYIGSYNHTANALVNNDGVHGTQCRTGTITLNAGTHPIAITFFQGGGGAAMQVWWTSTAAGIARQQIPNSAFDESVPFAGTAPAAPSRLRANATSFNRVSLEWVDNSNNETGFEIGRSVSKTGPFVTIATLGANTTSHVDSLGLSSSTRYFYRVRAIGQFGESAFTNGFQEARWRMNNSTVEDFGTGSNLTLANGAAFNTTAQEGSHSIFFDGSNDVVNISTAANSLLRTSFVARSVSLWIRPELTTSNRIIFDFGNSDNGLALRINNNALQAAVVSANTSRSVSAPFSSINSWHHVVVTYGGNRLRLYINGVLAAEDLSLPFTSVAANTGNSRFGREDGGNAFRVSANAHYRGRIDDVRVIDLELGLADVAALGTNTFLSADVITSQLPAIPAAATGLVASASGSSTVAVNWTDNASNETGYDVFRSLNNASNFRRIASLPAVDGTGSIAQFNDAGLFANAIYYYRVVATGIGGNSSESNSDSAKTSNDAPAFTVVANSTMKFGTIRNIAIAANDPNGDPVSLSGTGLPVFALLNDNGNGTGTLVLTPQLGDLGDYTITLNAVDPFGGTSSTQFQLVVDDNNLPVGNSINVPAVNEGATASVAISATDADGQVGLVISATGLPSFVTLTDNGNGAATLNFAPGYADADSYSFTLNATDSRGGVDSRIVTVVVNDVVPNERVLVNIQRTTAGPSPWNNITGLNTTGLRNTAGVNTGIGVQFQTTWWQTFDQGPVTGNNSGVYPDAVLRDYYFFGIFGGPNTVNVRVTGLNPARRYTFRFHAGSRWTGAPDNGTTIFSIGSESRSLNVQNNSQNRVAIENVASDAAGVVTFSMTKAVGTPAGYLNAFEIESAFDDGQAPAVPKDLDVSAIATGGARLTWRDVAYNETGYEVFRSTSIDDGFVLLNPSASNVNATSFDDLTALSNTKYYYRIRSINVNGASAFTAVDSVVTGNKLPVVTGGTAMFVKTDATGTLNIDVADDAGDVLTVTTTNLPVFATLVNNGNGSYSIVANPTISNVGLYNNIVLTARDDKGGETVRNLSISVSDKNTSTIYLNFGSDNMSAPAPWNNMLGYPFGTKTVQNMRDEDGNATTVDVTLVHQWTGTTDFGHVTFDNSGIYSDQVIRSGIYESTVNAKQMRLTGLSAGKLYNLSFFGSVNGGSDASATVSVGAQAVQLQARYNTNNVSRLNGLVPDANGEILVTITKNAAAAFAYLNAMVIESYEPTITMLAPIGLRAEATSRTSVSLNWVERSANETGYEVWRSENGGAFTLVASLPAHASSFVDNSASPNRRYHYAVRATNGSAQTEFTNVANVVTPATVVLLHFTNQFPAPAPWNNTNRLPQLNDKYGPLVNDLNVQTGFNVNLLKAFNGEFWAGMNTGNNSGIYPDPVLISSYWLDNGQEVQLKVDGLNQSMQYSFGFFASANWNFNLTGTYAINGRMKALNAAFNTTRAEFINGVATDNNGEVFIDISTTTAAQFGFLGALVIHGVNNLPQVPVAALPTSTPPAPIANRAPVTGPSVASKVADTEASMEKQPVEISAFPNPFRNEIVLKIAGKLPSNQVELQLLTADGNNVSAVKAPVERGNTVRMQTAALNLRQGVYFVRMLAAGKVQGVVKLLKIE